MNNRILSILVISSILISSMSAHTSQQTPQAKRAYNDGFEKGVAVTVAASAIAACIYITTTIKNGLFIPAKINCRAVFDGYDWKATSRCCNRNSSSVCTTTMTREPKYKTVCDDNPLFDALNDAPDNCSQMIQKIEPYMPMALALTCLGVFVGALHYLKYLDCLNQKPLNDDRSEWQLEQASTLPHALSTDIH